MAIVDLYRSLFGRKGMSDGNPIDMSEHGRVGGVSTGQPFKFVTPIDSTTGATLGAGLNIPSHDYISLSQDTTTDTWTFKSGGSGGTTVATITLTFTDSNKTTISSVART